VLRLLSPAKERVAEFVGFEVAASDVMDVIQTAGFDPVMVSVKFAAGRELWASVPGAIKLDEKTNCERRQHPVCPNDLRPRSSGTVAARFFFDAILSQNAKAPQAWPTRR
jgi:hypothetical protein